MKKPPRNKEEIPKLSGVKLARVLNVPERTLHQILRNAELDPTGGHDPLVAARAVIEHFKREASRMDSDAAKDRARKGKAEADVSEMERGKMKGTLCSRDDYRNNYADAIAQGVRNVARIKGLTKKQREEVFSAIRDVKLAKIKDE